MWYVQIAANYTKNNNAGLNDKLFNTFKAECIIYCTRSEALKYKSH